MPDPQAHIGALIDDMVATGPEAGLQVAAWHKGRLVVDDANPDTPAARRFERELHRVLGIGQ